MNDDIYIYKYRYLLYIHLLSCRISNFTLLYVCNRFFSFVLYVLLFSCFSVLLCLPHILSAAYTLYSTFHARSSSPCFFYINSEEIVAHTHTQREICFGEKRKLTVYFTYSVVVVEKVWCCILFEESNSI